ncbi:MAG: RdgB/HAM1 family non-canonical purine NTP pyrophosphatase [Bacteroidota bacterium]
MTLCFATNNAHKIKEISAMLPPGFELQSLQEIGCNDELPENETSIQGNSLSKAQYVWENFQTSCFADDSGLEVYALNGDPGVYSAMYAGPQRSHADNIELLLSNMEGKTDRSARFLTVITLVLNGEVHQFEGIAEGEILEEPRGEGGFGYDPVFQPLGLDVSFAEMKPEEKNAISHRARAFHKLINFLHGNTKF